MKVSFIVLSLFFLIAGCGETENEAKPTGTASKNKPTHFGSVSEKDRIESAVELRNLKETKEFTYIDRSTNKPFSGWAKMTWDNGQVLHLYEITDGEVTRFKKWNQNGIPLFDIGFIKGKWRYGYSAVQGHGTQNGLTIFFYQSGQKKSEENYKDGKQNGISTFYYQSGQKKSEKNYKDDMLDGLWVSWYEKGNKELEGKYKNGVREGLWTSWHENKQKKMEGNFRDGKEEGLVIKWYSSGQKKSETNYDHGKLKSAEVWKRNGKKCTITNVKDGDGILQYYHFNGKRLSKTNFKGGMKEMFVSWHKNGQMDSEENYLEGKKEGLWTKWYANGKKLYVENYKDGVQDGNSTWWYKNGQKRYEYNYKEGKKHGLEVYWYERGWTEAIGDKLQERRIGWQTWYRKERTRNKLQRRMARWTRDSILQERAAIEIN